MNVIRDDVIRAAREQGWKVTREGFNWRWTAPHGATTVVTPLYQNPDALIVLLREAGLRWPPERKTPTVTTTPSLTPVPPLQSYKCRYALATGCDFEVSSPAGRNYHENMSPAHQEHRVILTACPVCGDDLGAPQTRGMHMAKAHGLAGDSEKRYELDARQIKTAYDAKLALIDDGDPADDDPPRVPEEPAASNGSGPPEETPDDEMVTVLPAAAITWTPPDGRQADPDAIPDTEAAMDWLEAIFRLARRAPALEARIRELEGENERLRAGQDRVERIRELARQMGSL